VLRPPCQRSGEDVLVGRDSGRFSEAARVETCRQTHARPALCVTGEASDGGGEAGCGGSDRCAFFLAEHNQPGIVVEQGPTDLMFGSPDDARTADYVHGRFG
jgi:hypothetical protein